MRACLSSRSLSSSKPNSSLFISAPYFKNGSIEGAFSALERVGSYCDLPDEPVAV